MDKQDLPKQTEGDRPDINAPWHALDFEKVPARDAEATFVSVGADGVIYS